MKAIRRRRAKYGPTTPGPLHIRHLVAIVWRRIGIDENTWTDDSSLKNYVIVFRAVVHNELQVRLIPVKPIRRLRVAEKVIRVILILVVETSIPHLPLSIGP